VLDTNIEDEKYVGTVEAGDYVMLTSVASRLYTSHTFTIPIDMDSTRYTDIPISHVVGKFMHRDISLPTFRMLGNYVRLKILKNVDANEHGFIRTDKPTKTIGQVMEVGPLAESAGVYINDIVLIRDNVATNTMLDSKEFAIVSEDAIVGVFTERSFYKPIQDIIKLRHNFILMDEYQPDKVLGSSTLVLPQYDAAEDEGMSAIYSEETYTVLASNTKDILPKDLVYISRAATDYITILGKRYYLAQNSDFIRATVRGDV
jgi:co-chaperonin GroES (HSP10)